MRQTSQVEKGLISPSLFQSLVQHLLQQKGDFPLAYISSVDLCGEAAHQGVNGAGQLRLADAV